MAKILTMPLVYQAGSIERLAEKIDIQALRAQSDAVRRGIGEQLIDLEKELHAMICHLTLADLPGRESAMGKASNFVKELKAVVDQFPPSQLPDLDQN